MKHKFTYFNIASFTLCITYFIKKLNTQSKDTEKPLKVTQRLYINSVVGMKSQMSDSGHYQSINSDEMAETESSYMNFFYCYDTF